MRKKTAITALLLAIVLLAMSAVFLPAQTTLAADCKAMYTVAPGDTLLKVGQKYNASIADLTKANKLYNPYYTIYVRQSLCIPADADPLGSVPKYANSLAADYKARLSDKTLTINTTNFPKNSAYYIKVGGSGSAANTKIGQLNTKSGGSINASFALPDKYQKASQVSVCLKNNATDANVCRAATR